MEEPPSHVIFILATTEVDKVPATVVSRCQTYIFKKPTQEILEHSIAGIAKKEGYEIDAESAELIALLGDGSFRDTHVTLQKILSAASGKSITAADVARVTNAPSGAVVNGLVSSIVKGDLASALALVHDAAEHNVDFKILLKRIIAKVRIVMLMRFAPELAEKFARDLTPEDRALLAELLAVSVATERAYITQLPLELALVKLLGEKASG